MGKMKKEIHKVIFNEVFLNILPDILTNIFDDAIAFSMIAETLAKASEKALKDVCEGDVKELLKRVIMELELGVISFKNDYEIEVMSKAENVSFPVYAVFLGVMAGVLRACGVDVKIVTNPARLKLLPRGSAAIYLDKCSLEEGEGVKLFRCLYRIEKI